MIFGLTRCEKSSSGRFFGHEEDTRNYQQIKTRSLESIQIYQRLKAKKLDYLVCNTFLLSENPGWPR